MAQSQTDSQKSTSSPLLVALAWLVVVIPAGWGLNYTVQNALKIFTKVTATATPASVTVTAPVSAPLPVAPPVPTPAAK